MGLTLLLMVAVTMAELALRQPFLATLAGHALVALTRADPDIPIFAGPHRLYVSPRPPPWFLRALGRRSGTTLGHIVVLFDGQATHTFTLEAHEATHARQWTAWGTLPFLVAYFGSWLYQLARVRNARAAYYRIPFEVAAYRAARGPDWTPPGEAS